MNDEKNFPGKEKLTEQEKLLRYLDGNMPDEAMHDFEQEMMDDPFLNDAAEGLENIKQPAQLQVLASQLNQDLKKQLASRNKRKEKRKIKEQPWIYYAVILILLLIVIAYIVIKRAAE